MVNSFLLTLAVRGDLNNFFLLIFIFIIELKRSCKERLKLHSKERKVLRGFRFYHVNMK